MVSNTENQDFLNHQEEPGMATVNREEMEEMMRRWIAVNDKAEQEGNWRHLAE